MSLTFYLLLQYYFEKSNEKLKTLTYIIFTNFQFSISDSNVPEIRYELHAVQALSEAWVLYPNNPLSRAEAFSDLFQDFYPIENGWNVAGACVQFYTSKTRIFVDILAKDANGTNIIKIFN